MDYMKKLTVPMSQPDLTDLEREAVQEVLNTSALSMGPRILEFEAAVARFSQCQDGIAVNSGTAGLHLCVRAAGWQDGDWVITTPFSFVASTNVLLFERITPIFVDVDPLTGNIDAGQVAAAVRDLKSGGASAARWLPPTGYSSDGALKGILAVDVFGQPADYDALNRAAAQHGLKVIEDSCEALGAEYKQRKSGGLADMGVFAFYPNKQITTGEGGLIVTNDEAAAQMMRGLRNQGRAPGDTWLDHTWLGYNYRMDELSAALGAVQMSRIETLLANRQRVADWYRNELADVQGIELPVSAATTTRDSWFVFVIRLAKGIDRAQTIRALDQLGIPARPYFSPIHFQPYMRERFGYERGRFPVTEDLGSRGLALPFSGIMTLEQVQEVGAALRQVL